MWKSTHIGTINIKDTTGGTRIQNSQVFAGKWIKYPFHTGVEEKFREQIVGMSSKWQHSKEYEIINYYGEERPAEVHWF